MSIAVLDGDETLVTQTFSFECCACHRFWWLVNESCTLYFLSLSRAEWILVHVPSFARRCPLQDEAAVDVFFTKDNWNFDSNDCIREAEPCQMTSFRWEDCGT